MRSLPPPDDLRRRLPPQIEGPPRTIFMEILKIMKILEILMKFQKFLEFIPKKSLKTLGKMNDFHSDHEFNVNFLKFHENMKISLKSCNISSSCSIRSTACRTISKLPCAQFSIKKTFSMQISRNWKIKCLKFIGKMKGSDTVEAFCTKKLEIYRKTTFPGPRRFRSTACRTKSKAFAQLFS